MLLKQSIFHYWEVSVLSCKIQYFASFQQGSSVLEAKFNFICTVITFNHAKYGLYSYIPLIIIYYINSFTAEVNNWKAY